MQTKVTTVSLLPRDLSGAERVRLLRLLLRLLPIDADDPSPAEVAESAFAPLGPRATYLELCHRTAAGNALPYRLVRPGLSKKDESMHEASARAWQDRLGAITGRDSFVYVSCATLDQRDIEYLGQHVASVLPRPSSARLPALFRFDTHFHESLRKMSWDQNRSLWGEIWWFGTALYVIPTAERRAFEEFVRATTITGADAIRFWTLVRCAGVVECEGDAVWVLSTSMSSDDIVDLFA